MRLTGGNAAPYGVSRILALYLITAINRTVVLFFTVMYTGFMPTICADRFNLSWNTGCEPTTASEPPAFALFRKQ